MYPDVYLYSCEQSSSSLYSGVGIIKFSVYSWTPSTQNNILSILLDTQHLEQYTLQLGLLDSQYTPRHLAPRTIYSVYSQTPSTQNNIPWSWDYQILSILLDTQHLEPYTLELGLLDSQYATGFLTPRTIYSGVGIIRFSV